MAFAQKSCAPQRTPDLSLPQFEPAATPWSGSYVKIANAPDLWPFAFPDNSSFVVLAPPRRKRARRRPPAWRARAAAYAATLAGDEFAEAARDALRAGDDNAAVHALEVLAAIVAVAIAKLRKPSREYSAITEALQ